MKTRKPLCDSNPPLRVFSPKALTFKNTYQRVPLLMRFGVVRQILTRLKVPRSHKSMKRRFETTLREQFYVFAYKSACFLDVFHD